MERAIIANRKHDKGEVRKEMSERKMKRVEDSLTEQSHLLMPKCLNAAGYLFGGQLLAWIDETAGIVAKRHAEMNVVTVAVFSAVNRAAGMDVRSIFTVSDLPDYKGYAAKDCPLCREGQKLDGIVNTFGLVKF